ncbi:WD40 repeat-like protein [Trametopsis cervina]|nr:WD40 repeat-like protein [Trametopsis cervina]
MSEAAPSNDGLRYIKVSDLRCSDLPDGAHSYWVSIKVSQCVYRTAKSTRTYNPTWDEHFLCDVEKQSSMTLTVFRRWPTGCKKTVGTVHIDIDERLDGGVDQDAPLELALPGNGNGRTRHIPGAMIRCKITERNRSETVNEAILQAGSNVENMTAAPAPVQAALGNHEGSGGVADAALDAASAWVSLLKNIGAFAGLVEEISKIHPYAHAAWKVLSIIPAVIKEQLETDEQLQNLVAAMKRAHEFVHNAEALQKVKMHEASFEKLARATLECVHLIREYVRTDSFAIRAMENISGEAKKKFTDQIESFQTLMNKFAQDAIIDTELTVIRTLELMESSNGNVKKLADKSDLNDMMYARGAGCVPEKRCLKGTRRRLLEDIGGKLHGILGDEKSKRILLLTGVAGCGKSAIAHEIAHHFKTIGRLGASFCFNASEQAERSLDRFWSTISRGFADVDDGWKHALLGVIESDREMRTTKSPLQQFEEFILKPAQQLKFTGPIVVVIDAIDEVAEKDRDALVDSLIRLATTTSLHPNIRFLITSRPELRMVSKLQQLAGVDAIDISTANVERDMSLYVKEKLSMEFPESKREEITDQWAPVLVARAENLFQWIATACSFIIRMSPKSSPEERFLRLKEGQHSGLHTLYEAVLTQLVDDTVKGDPTVSKEDFIAEIRHILALIVAAREPLSLKTWTTFLGEDDAKEFQAVIPYLGSLFRGVSGNGLEVIQPAHTSFRDYVIPSPDSKKTHVYTVNTSAAEQTLTALSFRVMKAHLRFNICKLVTSYIPNKDVEDLEDRIKTNIPAALIYACRFWDTHLKVSPSPLVFTGDFRAFLDTKLLYWLEVMALNGMVYGASTQIVGLRKWIQDNGIKKLGMTEDSVNELDGALTDVDQFVSMCGAAISISTPHLYLSALAYAPPTSFITHHYSAVCTGGVRVINEEDIQWPQCILHIPTSDVITSVAVAPDGPIFATGSYNKTIELWNVVTGEREGNPLVGHTGWVNSVTFSPDGKTIASGSDDRTIRLWNVATRKKIGDALRGHTSSVDSVAFSCDGQRVISGSLDDTVRLWHVPSGEPDGEALVGHTDGVISVAFSQAGKTFASGSSDKTVRVWNADTREPLHATLEGHTGLVTSIAFSPDGRTLASGAHDKTIRLWDVATGKPKGGPLVGHTGTVRSVAFSPDGRTLASGSADETIRLWMVDTGRPVGNPLRGHTALITSVAFSKDGQTLISGAYDETIRVWKIQTVQAEYGLITGHSDSVHAVAFLPDHKTAASASDDGTVRLWDVRTGQPVGEPLQGHTERVLSVAFSPDGGAIASALHDHTIRLRDSQTGQLISEPLVGHSNWVNSVTFSPNGEIVASGSYDNTIRLWSAVTGEQLGKPLTGHTSYVRSVAFSPDGQCLASGSLDSTIMLWNVTTRQRIGEPLRGHIGPIYAVAFSPNGTSIASGSYDSTIRLWHVDTRESIGKPLEGHTDPVLSVAFSRDGKTLVSGSYDHTIRVWNVATHAPIGGPLRGHTSWVRSVAFSLNGMMILSGSNDRTVRLWGSPILDPAPPACLSSHGTPSLLPTPLSSKAAPADGDSTAPATGSMHNNVPSPDTSAASPPIEYTNSSVMDEDTGYILGPNDELLFWFPPEYRMGLWRPSTRWVAGTRSLHLDLSHFVHGDHWRECWDRNAT